MTISVARPQPQRFSKQVRGLLHMPGHEDPELPPWGQKVLTTPRNMRRFIEPRPAGLPAPTEFPVPPGAHDWVAEWFTEYQRREIQRFWHSSGWALWWACGAGKTVAACYWALGLPGPIVIVTRAGVKYQFARELERISDVKVYVMEGQDPNEDPIPVGTRAVSIGWELLPYRTDLLDFVSGGNATVLWDELHKAKSYKRTEKYVSDRGEVAWRPMVNITTAAANLSKVCARSAGLTATPFRNTLADLWSQLDILEPNCWGTNWAFVHRHCDAKPGKHGGLDTSGTTHKGELNQRLKEIVSIVRQNEVSAQLPPKRRQMALIRRAEQSRAPAFKRHMARAAKQGQQMLFEAKLAEAASRKRAWVAATAAEYLARGQHVTIFTGRKEEVKSTREAIEVELRRLKVDAVIQSGDGEDSQDERFSMCQVYGSTPGAACLIGTGAAFGEGIDGMQFTDLVIFQMLPWTPAEIEQWEGRFIRLGQDRSVLIIFPIAEGTVDEEVAELLIGKLQQVDSTVAQLGVQSEAGGVELTLIGDQDEIMARLLAAY
jgi:hypothetical protein